MHKLIKKIIYFSTGDWQQLRPAVRVAEPVDVHPPESLCPYQVAVQRVGFGVYGHGELHAAQVNCLAQERAALVIE
jgi:hypothetical protein